MINVSVEIAKAASTDLFIRSELVLFLDVLLFPTDELRETGYRK